MQIHTEAILLSYVKYGDSDVVVRLFTREKGEVSLLWKGVLSAKSKVKYMLMPLQIIEITYFDKGRDRLQRIYRIESKDKKMHTWSVSQKMIVLVLGDILSRVLRDEPVNKYLFQFLLQKIEELKSSNTQNFLQQFLLDFSILLGFEPYNNYTPNSYFDLEIGSFTSTPGHIHLSIEGSELWYRFLSHPQGKFKATERFSILLFWLDYFVIHRSGFQKNQQSLEIIKEVFS